MSNPFDFFDKIYCINLDERTDRWEKIQGEFKKVGIRDRVERFSAFKHDKYGLGNSLSHLEIIKKACQENLNNVFIFEDDAKFMYWDKAILSDAIKCLQHEDWRLFYIGYNLIDDGLKFKKISDYLIKAEKGSDIRSVHSYACNKSVFNYVIKNYTISADEPHLHGTPDPYWVIDMWLPQHFDLYCLVPIMSIQSQSYKPKIFLDNYLKYKF